jgi:very-short-patch-repair endonuclease
MERCLYCNKELKPFGKSHQTFCKENPNRKSRSGLENPMFGKAGNNQYLNGSIMSDVTKSKISLSNKNQILSDETKDKISESMKKAHSEGRAWNIGKSRWKNLPSYPELFFMKVIENEFLDKDYCYEYPIGIYSFDFAWPHKKKYIEIDGEQHFRFKEYFERDVKKDKLATDFGWHGLRISWKDLYKDPKKYIKQASDFIG